jgi:hypothetical protein
MKKLIVSIITIAISIFIIVGVYKKYQKADPISMKTFSNNELSMTIVSPHMEQKVNDNQNIIYCSTFQLCWNDMKDLVGGDLEIESNPEMVKYLNKSLSTEDDISEEFYIAEAGLKQDIETTVNEQLKSKFDKKASQEIAKASPDDLLAYSYLYKNLKFPNEFESMEDPLLFYENNTPIGVEAFGIKDYSDKNDELGDQVNIIDFINNDDFIVRLKTKSEKDELILAKVMPGDTLLETIDTVNNRVMNGTVVSLKENDILMIPKFSFDIKNRFTELINKFILNRGYTDYYVKEALQDITFVLDEKGAMVESKAFLSLSKSAEISRNFIFDQPFLLYMKEKGAKYPYFCMWIENTELMANYIE